MNSLIIFITKIIGKILNKFGRGSAFPGEIALMLNKNIKSYFKLPSKVIFVTGTNGKTSITGILTSVYEQNGFLVATNKEGSNLEYGILTCLINNSNLKGEIQSNVLILEVDERYIKKVINDIKPNYLIINSLSRDQPTRNGHVDIVFNDIQKQITNDMHLILNSDDPLVTKFGLNHKGEKSYYGLNKTNYSTTEINSFNLDMAYCPKCNKKLIFDYFHFGNVGSFKCSSCSFKRVKPDFSANMIDDFSFKIGNDLITMEHSTLYNVYNLLACFTLAVKDGLPEDKVFHALNNLTLNYKRLETLQIGDTECVLLLSKNENSVSYNQSLNYIKNQKNEKTIIIGFNNVSRRYDLQDLSWLWDINFEKLNDNTINKIICAGNFAYDIATRLKYANIKEDKLIICENSNELLNTIKEHGQNIIYCVICFEMETTLKKLLKEDK